MEPELGEDEMDGEWQEAWDRGLEPLSPCTRGAGLVTPVGNTTRLNNNNTQLKATAQQLMNAASMKDRQSKDTHNNKLDISDAKLPSAVSRFGLNDNKAGMGGLDKEKINQIIFEASKGSKYYENELKKEEQLQQRIQEQAARMCRLGDDVIKQGVETADRLLGELEALRDLQHTIVHIDMDAFYAAVEMRDQPSLKHKPMAVGGNSMLSTSNYLARRFGVRAAMPGFIGKKLCPDLVIVPTNFDKYKAVSQVVRSILLEYDPNMCPMSLDEAYLDITEHLAKRASYTSADRTFARALTDDEVCSCRKTENKVGDTPTTNGEKENTSSTQSSVAVNAQDVQSQMPETCSTTEAGGCEVKDVSQPVRCKECGRPVRGSQQVRTFGLSVDEAVHEMRFRIQKETTLTASAGIAPNMMLAKVCSDKNKPNGQYKIASIRQDVVNFISDLPIRKVGGIGKVSEKMLQALNVVSCTDLYTNRGVLYHLYSNISFNYFMRVCIGIGSTRVEREGERKSLSTERTFSEISKPAELYKKCYELCEVLSEETKEEQLVGKTVTLKLKLSNFEVRTRAHTMMNPTSACDAIYTAARDVLRGEIQAASPQPLKLRLMGVRLSNLLHERDVGEQKQETITAIFSKIQTRTKSPHHSPTKTAPSTATNLNPHTLASAMTQIRSPDPQSKQRQPSSGVPEVNLTYAEPAVSSSANFSSFQEFASSGRCAELSVHSRSQTMGGIRHACGTFGLVSFPKDDPESIERDSIYVDACGRPTLVAPQATAYPELHDKLRDPYSMDFEMEPAKVQLNIPDDPSSSVIKHTDKTSNSHELDVCSSPEEYRNAEKFGPLQTTSTDLESGEFGRHTPPPTGDSIQRGAVRSSPDTGREPCKVEDPCSDEPQQYECPVCYRVDTYADLATFTHHMDECLARGCVDDRKPHKQRNAEIPATGAVVASHAASTEQPTILVCPICNAPQRRSSLVLFNQHVDICLNRQTIKEVIGTPEPETSQKRALPKEGGSKTTTPKRLKGDTQSKGSPHRTLHNFFKPD